MNNVIVAVAAASIFALAPLAPAGAQMSGMLNNAMNSGSSGMSMPGMSMPGMGGLSLPSVSSASPTNVAGLLQYCVQNNYLDGSSGNAASSVKQSLLSKFTGSAADPTANANFTSGSNGVLDTGNGQSTTLGGTGIKAQVTQKVCSEVLSHGKSML